MINKLNFSTSDYHRKLQTSVLLLLLSCFVFVFVPYIVTDANAETASARLDWSKITLELDTGSNSGNVAFNGGDAIIPDEPGKVSAEQKTLTVNTTGKHFNVYLSMDSSVGRNNKLCYDFDANDTEKNTCTHTGMGVNPVAEDSGAPASLTGNDWGYALNDGESGFSSAGTYANANLSGDVISSTTTNAADLALYNAKFVAVPIFGEESLIWSADTNNPNGFGTNIIDGEPRTGDQNNTKTVVYGVKINNNLVAGTYGSKILYTAVASASDLNTPSSNIVSSLTLGGPTDLTTLYMDIDAQGAIIKEKNISVRLIKHSDAATADSNSDGKFTEAEFSSALSSSIGSCLVANNSLNLGEGSLNFGCVLPDLGLNEGTDYDFIVEVPVTGGLTRKYISYKPEGNDEGSIRYVGLQTKKNANDYYVDTMQGITTGVCAMTNVWGATVGSDARIYNRTGTGVALANTAEDSNALGLGTFALEDIRDNKEYLVRRLADGNCWMVQNLDLELADFAESDDLTPSNTDISYGLDTDDEGYRASWDPSASYKSSSYGTFSTFSDWSDSVVGMSQPKQFQAWNELGNKGTSGNTVDYSWGSAKAEDGTTLTSGENVHDSVYVANNRRSQIPRSYSNTVGTQYRYIPTNSLTGARSVYSPQTTGSVSDNPLPMTPSYTPKDVASNSHGDSGYTTDGAGNYYGNMYVGNYYNWYAATAESGVYSSTSTLTVEGSAKDSICPKGWQLPINGADRSNTDTNFEDKSWFNLIKGSYNLINVYGTQTADNNRFNSATEPSNRLQEVPLSIILSGHYNWIKGTADSRGYGGDYWASTPSSSTNARYLYFYSTYVYPQGGDNKVYGFAVRCVARGMEVDTVTENDNNIAVENTSSNGNTDETKRYTAKGDNLTLSFDLEDGIGTVNENNVSAYLVPHAAVANAKYKVTDSITNGANNYPQCEIGNNGITVDGTSVTIDCTVDDSGSGNAPEIVSTTASSGTDRETSNGYYDIWVHVPASSADSDYLSKTLDKSGNAVASLAFAGLQSHSDNNASSSNYVVSSMQDMTASVCKNTNQWGTGAGTDARIYNYTGSGTALANTAEDSNALGLGTFALKDARDEKDYLIRRLADGNCWMVQNLDYDLTISSNRILNPATTDVSSNKTLSTGWDLGAQIGSTCTEQYQTYTKHGGDCLWGSLKDTGANDGATLTAAANNARSAFARSYNNHNSNEYRYVATAQYDKGTGYVQYVQYGDNNKTMATTSFTPTEKGSSDHGDVPTTDGNGGDPSYSSFADGVYYGNMYIGTYYNWYAATAETNGTADSTYHTYYNGTAPTGSICPKGWQLPVNSAVAGDGSTSMDEYTDKSWSKLIKGAYDLIGEDGTQTAGNSKFPNASDPTKEASLRMHQLPLSIVFSGNYNWGTGALGDRGYSGLYWSSTPYSGNNAYYLGSTATYVNPRNYSSKPYGFPVRCVAR